MNVPLATFNGVDVDMLNVGDGDSILVTRWTNGMATRVLIDGGNKGSAATVKAFLLNRKIQYLDHIVCTHPHDDHAAGLIELVTDKRFDFGTFWMHLPWKHWIDAAKQRLLDQVSLGQLTEEERKAALSKIETVPGWPWDARGPARLVVTLVGSFVVVGKVVERW